MQGPHRIGARDGPVAFRRAARYEACVRDVTPIPPARAAALTAAQEAALLRAAVARQPGARALRLRLAALLIQLDAFDETIALLTAIEAGPADYPLLMALATAHLGRETPADNCAAAAITETALAHAGGDAARAAALADRAKAWLRLDMPVPALELLEQALRLDPHSKAAFRRLTTHWFASGDAGAVICTSFASI
jgi:tetratricopeptide (TPR) repeat protein